MRAGVKRRSYAAFTIGSRSDDGDPARDLA